jgi:hypothetical protein
VGHIVPKEYVDRLSKKGVTKGLGVPLPHWNVQKTLEVMDLNGIATSVVSISPHAFASLQTLAESSHIVLGTDYVFATQAAVPATIQGIREYTGFTTKDREAIEKENAMNLFPRLKKSS